jgi:hypothetical protein
MEKIIFDNGVREFCINGKGYLRFNPADPNVYLRLTQAEEKIRNIARTLPQGEESVHLLWDADRQLKEILNWVFGPGNDFNEIAGNVNLLAKAKNGRQVIDNLFDALESVLVQGARESVSLQVDAARQKAKARRAERV